MLLLALAVSLVQTPDLDKKISFTSVAKPVKRMLAELSKEAGVNLLTSQVLEREIVLLHLKAIPLSEAMSRIATATRATWQKEGDAYRLIRTGAQTRQQEREELAKRTEWIRSYIASLSDGSSAERLTQERAERIARDFVLMSQSSGGGPDFNYDLEKRQEQIALAMPGGVLLRRALAAVDPAELAAIPLGGRVVFSSKPTKMQRPFRQSIAAALSVYAADQVAWNAAIEKVGDPLLRGSGQETTSLPAEVPRSPEKVLLVVSQNALVPSIELELKVADGDGRLLGFQALNGGFVDPKAFTSTAEEEPIAFSALSKQHYTAVMDNRKPIPEPLRSMMQSPEAYDPLSYSVSEAFLGIAKARSKSIVAVLPDEIAIYWLLFDPVNSKLTPSMVLRGVEAMNCVEATDERNWMTFRPSEPVRSRLVAADRPALGRFLKETVASGQVQIESAARFARSIKLPRSYGALVRFFRPVLAGQPDGLPDLLPLRLYAGLTPLQRNQLINGGRFQFANLSQEQRANLHEMVYGGRVYFTLKKEAAAEGEMVAVSYSKMWDPTEFLPNGLPPNGFFTISMQEQVALLVYSLHGGYNGLVIPPVNVASYLVAKEQGAVMSDRTMDEFRHGKRTQMTFTFDMGNSMECTRILRESWVDPAQKRVPFSGLPASIRDEIEKLAEKYRKDPPFGMIGKGW